MIYFDNAATTFPKPKCVIRSVNQCLEKYCGNPGRSSHKLAVQAAEKVFEARENVAKLLSFDYPENVVFTMNATHALNTAIKGLIKEKCHIITSDMEHNSVLRPIYKVCKETNSEVSFFNTDKDIQSEIESLIRPDSKFLISTLASNVTGKSIDFAVLADIAKKHHLKLIIDASQYIGHGEINLDKTPCDVLCAPGHKGLFGLQGVGFAVIKNNLLFDTLTEGGSGSDSENALMPNSLPERFEAGTLPTPSIVGLSSGISFILEIGIDEIKNKLEKLTDKLKNILDFKGVKVYGCENGIACFNMEGIPAYQMTALLDKENIATRNGLHCSPMIHKKLGTIKTGAVRVSLSYLNREKELDKFSKVLKRIRFMVN